MTDARLEELQEKVDFTRSIGFALHGRTNIERTDFDIFYDKDGFLCEYLVITYMSGEQAAVNCAGDSLYAIFDEIDTYFLSGSANGHDGYAIANEYHKLRATGKSVSGLRIS